MKINKLKAIPLYGDDDFVFTKFPDLPLELKINILSMLEINEILIFQSLINDPSVKRLRLADITSVEPEFEYLKTTEESVSAPIRTSDKIEEDQENHKQNQTEITKVFDVMKMLNKKNQTIIPVVFNFSKCWNFPTDHLDELFHDATYFEIEFKFLRLANSQLKKLQDFKYSNMVRKISILKLVDPTGPQSHLQLDLINYQKLLELEFESVHRINIKWSLQTYDALTSLSIDDILDGAELLKFKNLNSLALVLRKDIDFQIKYIPQSVLILDLHARDRTKGIIIESHKDWPPSLHTLFLHDDGKSGFLEYLDLYGLNLESIDESCVLFNDPEAYPCLTYIEITSDPTYVSPKIQLPINLKILDMSKVKTFTFTNFMATHKSLEYLSLLGLSSLDFDNEILDKSKIIESNLEKIYLRVTDEFFPNSHENPEALYDKFQTCVGKTVEGSFSEDDFVGNQVYLDFID
ncbi:hypothetical protein DFJ63DRAFT_336009 [Scheffersomyces coipomensis]|uniref:uncharacterized protein n=1 Tax=Scheffersomyces coipomensis TaxID=1788519 RepID=UPI00315DF491